MLPKMSNFTFNVRLRISVFVFVIALLVGYLLGSIAVKFNPRSHYLASAESIANNHSRSPIVDKNATTPTPTPTTYNHQDGLEQRCADCRLTSNSIEDLLRKPRQMNAYGQMDERIDLDKIKKGICKDIINDTQREQCRNFYFTQLASIEKWKQLGSRTSFFDMVCIKELKYCCPRNSYGPRCAKCPECGKNEQCHGEGTRSGNGSCACKEGHTGPKCTSCLRGFYLESSSKNLNTKKDPSNKEALCRPCHKSCVYCRQEGPLGCEVCRSGYTWVPAYGCSDIDECIKSDKKICGDNTFCVNTEGSYFCYECDRACDGCNGDGPDMCLRCAKGYKFENGNCVALKKTILPPEANYYSFIGLGVSLYIGFSEYIMSTHIQEMSNPMISANPPLSSY